MGSTSIFWPGAHGRIVILSEAPTKSELTSTCFWRMTSWHPWPVIVFLYDFLDTHRLCRWCGGDGVLKSLRIQHLLHTRLTNSTWKNGFGVHVGSTLRFGDVTCTVSVPWMSYVFFSDRHTGSVCAVCSNPISFSFWSCELYSNRALFKSLTTCGFANMEAKRLSFPTSLLFYSLPQVPFLPCVSSQFTYFIT